MKIISVYVMYNCLAFKNIVIQLFSEFFRLLCVDGKYKNSTFDQTTATSVIHRGVVDNVVRSDVNLDDENFLVVRNEPGVCGTVFDGANTNISSFFVCLAQPIVSNRVT